MELLQNKLRPNNLKDVLGQKHLIGKGKVLTNLVKNKVLFNIIFYGNSGCGKTTIALALINELGIRYRMLNATINSKKDFEVVIEEAKMYGSMILIVDEIHRMNKDKQDILLPYIEEGFVYLIGCTTQNPYISINKAIRSRCHLLEVKPLTIEETISGIKNAISNKNGLNNEHEFEEAAIEYIANSSNGDLRFALNYLQALSMSCNKKITLEECFKENFDI